MPFMKILVHVVWSTKNREAFLHKDIRRQVLDHIRANAHSKDIFIDCIGGGKEHVHVLISLGAKQSIADVVHLRVKSFVEEYQEFIRRWENK